jgi:hypothetical protein
MGGLDASGDAGASRGMRDATTSDGRPTSDGRTTDAHQRNDSPSDAGSNKPAPCVSDCPNGAPCDGGPQCASLACMNSSCVPCSPACGAGAKCSASTDCASAYCTAAGVCANAASCAEILKANAAIPNGTYVIEPAGGNGAFSAYCDMTDEGGGWTLVLKMGTVGSPGTFAFSKSIWTDDTVLEPGSTDMSQTEAKFPSYFYVPFTSMLGMMSALGQTTLHTLVIPVSDSTSLQHLMGSTPNSVLTNLGPAAWMGLTVPDAAIQPNCNREGINIVASLDAGGCVGASVRIGIIANDQNDCCSPNSYVGFGGGVDGDINCDPTSVSAGSMAGITCTGGTMNIQDFGYVFVR